MSQGEKRNNKKVFLENFLSLSILQFVTNALPIVTIPYLTRTLGLEGFGIYVFVQALVNFMDILVSYGFRVSATDQIAKVADDMDVVSRIFWNVLFTKLCLFFVAATLLICGVILVPALSANWMLIALGFPLLFGNLMFPVWLFQGLQEMKFITLLHLISKTFFVVAVFVFVEETTHLDRAIFLHACGALFAGVLSLLIAISRFNLTYCRPTMSDVLLQLASGRDIFFTADGEFLYHRKYNYLGIFHPGTIVAAYALGDKVYRLVGSLSAPFNRAIFPILSAKYFGDRSSYVGVSVGQ